MLITLASTHKHSEFLQVTQGVNYQPARKADSVAEGEQASL